MAKVAVDVVESVERQGGRVVRVVDEHYFGSGGACQDDGRCFGIGRGDDSCCRKGHVDGGGEGEAQVFERASAEVGVDRR